MSSWTRRAPAAALKQAARPVRMLPILPCGLMPGRDSGALDKLTKDRLRYTAVAAHTALGGEIADTS